MNVGHGKHAATKKGCNFGRADLIILGFSAVDRFHVQGMAEYESELSVFNEQYSNEKTEAPAIDPATLLKIILFAYSQGIISSRRIARECEENVVFTALAADTRPHFTTVADFVSSMSNKMVSGFRRIAVCTSICFSLTMFSQQIMLH